MKFTCNRLHDWVVSEEGEAWFVPNINFLATPVHDVIDINCIKKCLFELKMHHYRWLLVLRPRPYFRASGQRTTYAQPSDQWSIAWTPVGVSKLPLDWIGAFQSHVWCFARRRSREADSTRDARHECRVRLRWPYHPRPATERILRHWWKCTRMDRLLHPR